MIGASLVESAGPLLTVLTPLVAVPLTVITFYLRSLREHQVSWHADLVRRVESVEALVATVREAVAEFERDYTTKEEWLRECMMARRTLEQLSETTVRIETTMHGLLISERARPDAGLMPADEAVRDQTGARKPRDHDGGRR